MSTKKEDPKNNYFVLGMCSGVTFGIIFDNLALWLSLGTALGLLADSYINKKSKDTDEE